MMNQNKSRQGFAVEAMGTIAVTAAIAALAAVISEFQSLQITSWAIYGLLALSLVLVWGHAGIFSFGQGALFGIGAYAYGVAAINLIGATSETFSAVAIAVAVAAIAAAFLGYFMFYGKVGDVYVGIITLATTLVLFTFLSSTAGPQYHIGEALLGGYNGMTGVPPLSYGTPGEESKALSPGELLVFTATLAGLVTLGVYRLLRGSFGRVLAGLRENELRTQLLGYDIRFRKLVVFAIGGAIAGLAGAIYAAWAMFISPAVFGLQQAALVVIWVLVGGRTSVAGAFVGVVLVDGLASFLGGSGGNATPIILGAVLIGVVLLLPQGLVPAIQTGLGRLFKETKEGEVTSADETVTEKSYTGLPVPAGREGGVLEVVDLHKRFGGVTAVEKVTLSFSGRGVHCLIGPNGAGKSTFFNLLVGRYWPTTGTVMFAGNPITRAEAHERVRRGLGIKLQVASIFAGLTTFENVWLAAFGKLHDSAAATGRASKILAWLGLADRARDQAGVLSHGQKQWLEIGMVLASEPSVILLDEPTAGMTREETLNTAELIKELGKSINVIVVEHDMEFVRHLDVPVTVFHQGNVFAQGSLDELRQDERILDIYLGRGGKAVA